MSFGYGGFGDGFGNGFNGAWGNQGFGSQRYSNAAGGNNPSLVERNRVYNEVSQATGGLLDRSLVMDICRNCNYSAEKAIVYIIESGVCASEPALPPRPQIPTPKLYHTISQIGDASRLENVLSSEVSSMEAFSNTLLPSIFAIPDLSNFSLSAQESITSKIIDRSMTIDLENQNLINDDPDFSRLRVLKVEDDGNCLLHAVSVGLTGVHDRKLLLRKALKDIIFEGQNSITTNLKKRWENNQFVGGEIMEKDFKDLQDRVGINAKPNDWGRYKYQFLEASHVLFLAHLIKRPIIIYAANATDETGRMVMANEQMGGIYLPFEIDPQDCFRTPLVLAFGNAHFAPCVVENNEIMHSVKLSKNVIIQFKLEHENEAELLNKYLNYHMAGSGEKIVYSVDIVPGELTEGVRFMLETWLSTVIGNENIDISGVQKVLDTLPNFAAQKQFKKTKSPEDFPDLPDLDDAKKNEHHSVKIDLNGSSNKKKFSPSSNENMKKKNKKKPTAKILSQTESFIEETEEKEQWVGDAHPSIIRSNTFFREDAYGKMRKQQAASAPPSYEDEEEMDEELRKAIAMSLGEETTSPGSSPISQKEKNADISMRLEETNVSAKEKPYSGKNDNLIPTNSEFDISYYSQKESSDPKQNVLNSGSEHIQKPVVPTAEVSSMQQIQQTTRPIFTPEVNPQHALQMSTTPHQKTSHHLLNNNTPHQNNQSLNSQQHQKKDSIISPARAKLMAKYGKKQPIAPSLGTSSPKTNQISPARAHLMAKYGHLNKQKPISGQQSHGGGNEQVIPTINNNNYMASDELFSRAKPINNNPINQSAEIFSREKPTRHVNYGNQFSHEKIENNVTNKPNKQIINNEKKEKNVVNTSAEMNISFYPSIDTNLVKKTSQYEDITGQTGFQQPKYPIIQKPSPLIESFKHTSSPYQSRDPNKRNNVRSPAPVSRAKPVAKFNANTKKEVFQP